MKAMSRHTAPAGAPRRRAGIAALCAGALALAACAEPRAEGETVVERVETDAATFRVVQVVGGLEHPWGLAWLPDGRMLVTERGGRLNLIDDNGVRELSGLPPVFADDDQRIPQEGGKQSGLLDVVVHPDYADNGWIYFTYSSPGDPDAVTDGSGSGTAPALARARLNDDSTGLTDVETLYVAAPRTNPGRHYGSRIVFPGDGTVFMSVGDRGVRHVSQDLTHPGGSILRLRDAGGAPDDNPFVGVAPGNLRPEIWSFGHRNNQGLVMHPDTGTLWATDHGPAGGDLLYRVERGANYGWPQVAFGLEYSTGEPVGIGESAPGVTAPAHVWEASSAPSGLAVYTGDEFPGWRGNLFAGFLARQALHRVVLDGDEVAEVETVLDGQVGRIRDVRQGPDGRLYLLTDQADGGVFRIEAVD